MVARKPENRHHDGNGRRSLAGRATDPADRLVAIAAHRRRLSSLLGRDVSFAVAALDFLLYVRRELVAPAAVELEVLDLLDRRIPSE